VLKGAKKEEETLVYDFDILIDVKGWKALGNRLSNHQVTTVKLLASKVKDDKEVVLGSDQENFEVGDTIDFDKDKPDNQLGLFK
jgi:topoisomerase IV subunit A